MTRAVVLCAGAVDPAAVLAGMPLVLRAVLTLQKAGVSRVTVVTSGDAPILDDGRIKVELDVVAGDSLGAARDSAGGPALVVRHDVVFDPALAAALLRTPMEGAQAIMAGHLALVAELDDDHLAAARPVDLPGWSIRVDDESGRRRAVTALFDACRKPLDGIVSRHLNRHVSIFISKRIVDTAILPNHVTVFTLLLGLVASAMPAMGGYAMFLLGAALYQLASILDGVDGELARVRFQHSAFGEWLDNIADDILALAFWVGITLGARAMGLAPWLVLTGWVACGAHVLFLGVVYRERLRRKSGSYFESEWTEPGRQDLRTRVVQLLVMIPRRDFFVFFCLCAAVGGVLPYMLPVIAVACVATLAASVVRNLRRVEERASG